MHEMQKRFEREIGELAASAVRLHELGYVASYGGNLSYRAAPGVVLITPTKVPKQDVGFDDVCVIDERGGVLFAAPGRKPTGETPFHLRILSMRPDTRAVVHAHPPVLTGFAIARSDALSRPILPEPVIEVGPVVSVPYAEPLSDELAAAFDPVVGTSNAFLMENHGVIALSAEGVRRAIELLEMLEAMACSVFVARCLGGVRELSADDVDRLDVVLAKRNGALPGLPGAFRTLKDVFRM